MSIAISVKRDVLGKLGGAAGDVHGPERIEVKRENTTGFAAFLLKPFTEGTVEAGEDS